MISYTTIRLADAVFEIQSRVRHYRNSFNYDWGSVVTALNGAIAEVTSLALPYSPTAYKQRLEVTSGQRLGASFIKHERLYVYDEDAVLREARYADPKELFKVTDFDMSTIWNEVSLDNPIYTIFGNIIYFSNMPIQSFDIVKDSSSIGIFEGYYFPNPVSLDGDRIVCPTEFIELIYLHTLTRLYNKGENINYISVLYREIELLSNSLIERNRKANEIADQQLESFVTEQMLRQGFGFKNVRRR